MRKLALLALMLIPSLAVAQSSVSVSGTFPIPSTNVTDLTAQRIELPTQSSFTCNSSTANVIYSDNNDRLRYCDGLISFDALGYWEPSADGLGVKLVTDSLNVGIGLDNPTAKLEILENGLAANLVSDVGNDIFMGFSIGGGNIWSFGVDNETSTLRIASGSTLGSDDTLVIDGTSSNIGIGTAIGTSKLLVDGTLRATNDVTFDQDATIGNTAIESDPNDLLIGDADDPTGSFFVSGTYSSTMTVMGSPLILSEDGASDRLRIHTDGNVGIGGESAPAQPLHVDGNIRSDGSMLVQHASAPDMAGTTPGNGWLQLIDSGGITTLGIDEDELVANSSSGFTVYTTDANGTFDITINGSNAFTVDTTGQTYIRDSGEDFDLEIDGRADATRFNASTDIISPMFSFEVDATESSPNPNFVLREDASGNTWLNAGSGQDIVFSFANSEIMNISQPTGSNPDNVGVGIDRTPEYALDVNGTVRAQSYLYSSDKRLKNNIKTANDALDIITNLRGVYFNWNETDVHASGLIAQEVENVLPHAVKTDSKGFKAVDYPQLTGLLIEAVKQQQEQINALQKEIEKLRHKNTQTQ